MVHRVRVCAHCSNEFTTSQYAAKYCSVDCRAKSRNTRTASKRISNLPTSDEWLWVAREAKRAGTVEILKGISCSSDLVELFSLYRRRYKCYGWDSEKKVSKFHLCHIASAQGKDTVGLLHHLNLFIGNSLPNQVRGADSYAGEGLSISRNTLKSRWKVGGDDSDKAILAKIQKYLGLILIEYAKTQPIRKSQRFSLAKKIYQEHPTCGYSLSELEKMGLQALRKLKASLDEEQLYTLSLTPKRSLVVYIEELDRFSKQHPEQSKRDDFAFMSAAVRCVCSWLWNEYGEEGFDSVGGRVYGFSFNPTKLREGMDGSKLRNFIAFQAFDLLQGGRLERQMIKNTLKQYLEVVSLDYKDENTPCQFGVSEWVAEARDNFLVQFQLTKYALHTLDLVDAELMYWHLESKKEALKLQSFYEEHSFSECLSQLDYPDDYYQVENDYVPSLPSDSVDDLGWLPF